MLLMIETADKSIGVGAGVGKKDCSMGAGSGIALDPLQNTISKVHFNNIAQK